MKVLEKWVKDGLVDTVVAAGVDMQGRLYGKRCAAKAFLNDLHTGVHTCDCNFGWDIERMLIPNLEFTGWHKGYGDMTSVPDWSTLRLYSWIPKTALVICDTCDHEGNLVSIAPRTILRKQVDRAKTMGFNVKAAPEIEFFLFRETLEGSRANDYRDLEPISRYISDYSIFRSSMDEWIIGPMRRALAESNVDIECNKAEWGHGQFEINLVYGDVLEIADRHVIFKHCIREMAALNGIQATFMAKWDSKHSGNGAHVHMSLWRGDDPAFPDEKGEHRMSTTMRHFLGGMMALCKDLQLFYMPSINSYKRIEDLSFAPSNVTWGGDNRTTSFRVAGHGTSMRLENRIPGSDANSHLLYAAMIASGLYGIENGIEPVGPFVEANAYALDNPPSLHRNLTQATDAFDASKTARQLFGDDVVNHYAGVARWEIAEFEKYVTDWERRRYFELI